jgi:hypothetical protein
MFGLPMLDSAWLRPELSIKPECPVMLKHSVVDSCASATLNNAKFWLGKGEISKCFVRGQLFFHNFQPWLDDLVVCLGHFHREPWAVTCTNACPAMDPLSGGSAGLS